MRARKRKHGAERLAAAAEVLCHDKAAIYENPQSPFDMSRPLCLEIGCGKGKFSCEMANAYPNANFYAMEKVEDVMVCAVEKAMAQDGGARKNLRFIIGDAKELTEWFPPHTFDCIFLNFSDPWPKKGYYKRRLTYRAFLEIYKTLLKKDGILRLKTDNVGLFDFSLEEFEAAGMEVIKCSRDLHASEYNDGNIMTEYETNFSSQGMPINFAEVKTK
ncbi:MAG: tRNA (guanosine(46)-N7)-methyltransferase TrmB [Clostridia bacterium]|nr:tRNA (guanosine(46)-N7)-methyltransferase TrmB [Clostridia bacterium]